MARGGLVQIDSRNSLLRLAWEAVTVPRLGSGHVVVATVSEGEISCNDNSSHHGRVHCFVVLRLGLVKGLTVHTRTLKKRMKQTRACSLHEYCVA